MKSEGKTEYFVFEKPLEEPNISWNLNDKFHTHREEKENGEVVWFGYETNWKKEPDSSWKVLSTNENAIPLEKYLPEILYDGDRIVWANCEIPLYEKLYLEQFKKK